MGYKMKGYSYPGKSPLKQDEKCYIDENGKKVCPMKRQSELAPKKPKEKLDHVGTGFMNPPYKDTVKRQKQGVPYAKRQGYHGFKNFDSVIPQFQKNKK